MSFYEVMKNVNANVSFTENGMEGYKTTFHPLLDMNFKISSYRNKTDKEICEDINKIVKSEDFKYLLKFLFMVRGVREGLGERRLFKVALKHLVNEVEFEKKDEIVKSLITQGLVAEFGRYDDLFLFVGTKYESVMVDAVLNQLRMDYKNMAAGKSVSLLAKWMPSENASSKETKKLARLFIKAFGANSKTYRQVLSKLRAYIKVTEVYTSANEWGKIDYNQVPSKANLKYKDAFLRHDEERRRDFLAALRVGVDKEGKTVKINSSVNFPHEIVAKYMYNNYWHKEVKPYDEALEQLWKNLKHKEGLNNTVVVRDGSGSMISKIGDSNVSALDVATALAIYCSENLNAEFKDKFITFSRHAKLVDLSECNSLRYKIAECLEHSECENTDIESVFNLILRTGVEGHLSQDEMPKQILIISDMEFDSGANKTDSNVFREAAKRFKEAGYKLPKLVFWNVNSRTNTIPMKENENGVVLVSGFSVNTLNMVLNGETDPFKAFIKELDTDTYKNIPYLVKKEVKNKKVDFTKPNWL